MSASATQGGHKKFCLINDLLVASEGQAALRQEIQGFEQNNNGIPSHVVELLRYWARSTSLTMSQPWRVSTLIDPVPSINQTNNK